MSFRRLWGGALGRCGQAGLLRWPCSHISPHPHQPGPTAEPHWGNLEKRRATKSHFQPPAAPQAWFCLSPSLWPLQRPQAAFLGYRTHLPSTSLRSSRPRCRSTSRGFYPIGSVSSSIENKHVHPLFLPRSSSGALGRPGGCLAPSTCCVAGTESPKSAAVGFLKRWGTGQAFRGPGPRCARPRGSRAVPALAPGRTVFPCQRRTALQV